MVCITYFRYFTYGKWFLDPIQRWMQVKYRLSCSIKCIERLNPWGVGCTKYGWSSGSLIDRCWGQMWNWYWIGNIRWFLGHTKIHRLWSGCWHLHSQSFTFWLHNCILSEELLLSPAYSSVAWKVGFSARDEEKNESHLRCSRGQSCSESGSQS